MTGFWFWAALVAFVAERAHQWQSLTARDASFRWHGRAIRRRVVITTALVIGWGEGLGFYVQSQKAFWAMVFWVLVLHVVITGVGLLRGASPAARWLSGLGLGAVALLMVAGTGESVGDAAASWLGHGLVPGMPAFPGASPVALVALVLAFHAIPCFVRNLRRVPRPDRLKSAAVAVACATLEWWLVAKSIWFPEAVFFPDLVDWWDLGHGAHFLLHPIWMAPFFAHVVIDALRFFGPSEVAP